MFKNELFISDSTKTIRSLALNFYALVVVMLILRISTYKLLRIYTRCNFIE